MINKLGSEEAYLEYLRELGSRGGKKSKPPADHPGKFDNNRELASRAGKISRRKSNIDSGNDKRIIEVEGEQ